MKYSKRNLIYHELIGLRVIIKDHTDPTLKGISGKVVDETKNTLRIATDDGREVTVLKHGGRFIFKLPKTLDVEVLGDMIIGRPEDRLKRIMR